MDSHLNQIVCWTCDVEIERKNELKKLRRILQVFKKYRLKGTFFFRLSPHNYHFFENSDLLKYFNWHEFGLHIHWGESIKKGLQAISTNVLKKEIGEKIELCMKLGFRPKSFRGGGLSQTTAALSLIKRYGFQVDSSVAAKLNEQTAWFQNHLHVPYKSWYFPSKKGYDIPSSSFEDRFGLLEIPVTRLIPSFTSWFPYTLDPATPLYRAIINENLYMLRNENPLLITPICHSWGDNRGDFDRFLEKLDGTSVFNRFIARLNGMIKYTLKKKLKPLTLIEVYDLLM